MPQTLPRSEVAAFSVPCGGQNADDESRLHLEALRVLDGRGLILETARDLSRLFRDCQILAAVIGGVAVVLHGHVRTTTHVNVLIQPPLALAVAVLKAAGYAFDPVKREFRRACIPVRFVLADGAELVPIALGEIDGITTVSLPRLINMKLRTGSKSLLRAQDMADVIGLVRHHALSGDFTRHIDRDLRPEFRRLIRALQREQAES